MNKTEERYAWELLVKQRAGEILDFKFEQLVFRLTRPQPGMKIVSYTPDFCVVLQDGTVRFDEVKGGYVREDADLKFKLASDLFPWFGWRMISLRPHQDVKILRDVPRRVPRLPDGRVPETDDGVLDPEKVGVQGSGRGELRREGSKGHQDDSPQDPGGDAD